MFFSTVWLNTLEKSLANPSGPAALPDGRMLYLCLFCSGIFYLSSSTMGDYFQGAAYSACLLCVQVGKQKAEQLHPTY